MSLRIDTAELISGAYVIGETGLGVLGSDVPSTGLYGASYLYNDLTLPADASKEVRGLIVTPPSAGTFYAWEDGSFSLVGAPDGVYTFVYRLYVDGVDLGTATDTITIGDSAVISGSATLGDISATGTLFTGASDLSGTATLGDVSATGTLFTGASIVTGTATLGNITASGSLISTGNDTFTGPFKSRIGSATLRAPSIRIGSPTL